MKKIKLFKGVEYFKEILPNGLTIKLYPDKTKTSYFISYAVKVGSRDVHFKVDEREYLVPNGTHHFLEHLTFKMENGVADDFFHEKGCYVNAFTNTVSTNYVVEGNNDFSDVLSYLMYFVDTPFITDELVENEKKIIIEEIKMYSDDPNDSLYTEFDKMLIVNDPVRNLVAGSVDDVEKITKEDLFDVYNSFYIPSNMCITITGNFDINEAIEIIKKNVKDNKVQKVERIYGEEPTKVCLNEKTIYCNVALNKVKIGYKIPSNKEYDRTRMSYLLYLIMKANFSYSSELGNNLIKEHLITSNIAPFSNYKGSYLVAGIEFETNHLNITLKRVKKQFRELKFTQDDLERLINSEIFGYVMRSDNISSVNNILSTDFIYDEETINIIDYLRSFKLEEVLDLINEFKINRRVILELKPGGKKHEKNNNTNN